MSNILEYTLSLNDQVSSVLKKIGVENTSQMETWAQLEKIISRVDQTIAHAGNTINGLIENIKSLGNLEEWLVIPDFEFIQVISDGIGKVGDFFTTSSDIVGKFGAILDTINTGIDSFVSKMVSGLDRLSSFFEENFSAIGESISSIVSGIKELFDKIGGVIEGILPVFDQFTGKVDYTLSLNDQVSPVLKKIGVENTSQMETWAQLEKIISKVDQTIAHAGNTINGLIENIKSLGNLEEWLVIPDFEFIQVISDGIGKVGDFFTTSSDIVGKFGAILDTINTGIDSFISKMVTGLERLSSFFEDFFNSIISKVDQTIAHAGNTINGLIENIKSLGNLEEWLVIPDFEFIQVISDGIGKVGDFFTTSSDIVGKFGAILDTINTGIDSFVSKMVSGLERLSSYFEDFFNSIWTSLEPVITGSIVEIGKLFSTCSGVVEKFGEILDTIKLGIGGFIVQIMVGVDRVISLFEGNFSAIGESISSVVSGIKELFDKIGGVIEGILPVFDQFTGKVDESNPAIMAMDSVIGGLTTTLALFQQGSEAASLAMQVWTKVQAAWNAIMSMNPVFLIIAGIIALIAAIAFVAYKTDGWGKQWDSIVNFMKYSFQAFVESIKFGFNTVIDGVMIGLNKIKLGWYQFKNAVGIGNKDENQNMISDIQQDIDARKKAIEDGRNKVIELSQKAKDSLKFELSWNNERSLGDITSKIKKKLGIGGKGKPEGLGGEVDGDTGTPLSPGEGLGGNTLQGISSGGTRSTNIAISIGNLVENMVFDGGYSENASEVERDMAEAMLRVLNMAQSSVN